MSNLTVAAPGSRPKIHRPPAFIKRPSVFAWLTSKGGMAAVAIALAAAYLASPKETVVAATMLPEVAVISERVVPASGLISEAHAAIRPGVTVTFKDKSGEIVGQMAKIPLENEQITEIKPINDVDNRAGRDLLSILSKY